MRLTRFPRYIGFYKIFTQDFSKFAKPLNSDALHSKHKEFHPPLRNENDFIIDGKGQ